MLLSRRALPPLLRALVLLALVMAPAACREAPTSPTPQPSPSPQPSPTPGLRQALDGSKFTISFNGALLATEEIRVDSSGNQPIVFSEIRQSLPFPAVERRTMVISSDYEPLQYELDRAALGVRSTWAAERTDDALEGLGNNLDWYGPVLIEGVTRPPDIMIDSTPSALPFALIALRFAAPGSASAAAPAPLRLSTMDIIEGLAATRPLTMTTAPDRKGAVIGTSALEGHIGGGANQRFTLWVRPGSQILYSVEIPDYAFDPWRSRSTLALRERGRLVIQRVSKFPESATPQPESAARALDLGFLGADKTARSGTLTLPDGAGPFPVIVAHSGSGVVPRSRWGDQFGQGGWAVYSYDKRGLGQSEGQFERGPAKGLAEDAMAAAEMLAQRPEIDPQRIVFFGLGDGGLVGAQVMATPNRYAGAILGSCASATRVFPDLAQGQLRTVLGAHYGWADDQIAVFANQSANRWESWMVDGKDEIEFARRRVSVDALRDWADVDLPAALSAAGRPVLLLHGEQDRWTPVAGAQALDERLRAQGRSQITLRVFAGLDDSLASDATLGIMAPMVQEAIMDWLNNLPR